MAIIKWYCEHCKDYHQTSDIKDISGEIIKYVCSNCGKRIIKTKDNHKMEDRYKWAYCKVCDSVRGIGSWNSSQFCCDEKSEIVSEEWYYEWASKKREQCFPYVIDTRTGEKIKRIPFGEEQDDWGEIKCGDCGVSKGEYHLNGCDIERSPLKGEENMQLLTSEFAGDFIQ